MPVSMGFKQKWMLLKGLGRCGPKLAFNKYWVSNQPQHSDCNLRSIWSQKNPTYQLVISQPSNKLCKFDRGHHDKILICTNLFKIWPYLPFTSRFNHQTLGKALRYKATLTLWDMKMLSSRYSFYTNTNYNARMALSDLELQWKYRNLGSRAHKTQIAEYVPRSGAIFYAELQNTW